MRTGSTGVGTGRFMGDCIGQGAYFFSPHLFPPVSLSRKGLQAGPACTFIPAQLFSSFSREQLLWAETTLGFLTRSFW